MKVITVNNIDLVIDNIIYLVKYTVPEVSYSAVLQDGTSLQLTESQFNEAKTYLLQ